jgi:hypothetical protein
VGSRACGGRGVLTGARMLCETSGEDVLPPAVNPAWFGSPCRSGTLVPLWSAALALPSITLLPSRRGSPCRSGTLVPPSAVNRDPAQFARRSQLGAPLFVRRCSHRRAAGAGQCRTSAGGGRKEGRGTRSSAVRCPARSCPAFCEGARGVSGRRARPEDMRSLVGSALARRVLVNTGCAFRMDAEDLTVYGPQLDIVPAAVSAGILAGAALFRAKIDGAIAARQRAEQAVTALKLAKQARAIAMMTGGTIGEADGDLAQQEADAEALVRAAEAARTVSIGGLNLRVMVPLPLGSPAPGTDRPVASDKGEQPPSARTETPEWRRVALGIMIATVVLAQVGLLSLLATDP